jgi:hypothetical protein
MLFYLENPVKIDNDIDASHVEKHIFGKKKVTNIIKRKLGLLFG